ncbi:hypothetical protein ABZX99_19435 [Streptomyces antibioticus]|uniref:hypothetical protein n=1 Tax=Streptomyces antibioticus TaxID=1890 RepID=UPI0033B3472C
MATAPSREEILKAVERHIARRGGGVHVTAAGAADFSWQSLFDCQVLRSIERREETSRKEKGRRAGPARQPTYTDLDAYTVPPPAHPGLAKRYELVREGSLDELECPDCEDGRKDCATCEGRGGRDCPRDVECAVCHGGPDTCWECDGTGHPRSRRARAAAAPRPDAAEVERATCSRCRRPDVACPSCRGRRQTTCAVCSGTGLAPCADCKGARRVRDEACGGTGRFTVWTQGVITHTPDREETKVSAPAFLRVRTDQWNHRTLRDVGAELPDFLDDEHRKLAAPLLAVKDGEILRRVTLRHLPLARVALRADPDRVYYAYPGPGGIVVHRRPSKERVTALVWAALTVVALVTVVALTVLR